MIKLALFNVLTRRMLTFTMNIDSDEPTLSDRMKAFIADKVYVFFVALPFLVMGAVAAKVIEVSWPGPVGAWGLKWLDLLTLLPLYGLCVMLFNKDFYGGQSVVNRLWGYRVVDVATGVTPGPFKCMLRNVTVVVLPIELLFVSANPERRLGDFIAGTKLIKVERGDPQSILKDLEHTDTGGEAKLALLIPTLMFIAWAM